MAPYNWKDLPPKNIWINITDCKNLKFQTPPSVQTRPIVFVNQLKMRTTSSFFIISVFLNTYHPMKFDPWLKYDWQFHSNLIMRLIYRTVIFRSSHCVSNEAGNTEGCRQISLKETGSKYDTTKKVNYFDIILSILCFQHVSGIQM